MLVGKRASNHPQQVGRRGADREVDDRATVAELFDPLNERFGGFTVDVAAAAHNYKVARYYDLEVDGLAQSWAGERVWCNPPYSSIAPWVAKAWEEREAECVVMLLPANRTEQTWWCDLVEPYRDRPGSPLRVEFLRGRWRFLMPGQSVVPPNSRPPFGCCLLIWQRSGPTADPALFGKGEQR